MTVKQLFASMDSKEFTEWMAYDRYIETIGDAREDLRTGILASATANHGARDIKKPYKPSDFMPFLERDDDKPLFVADKNRQSALILSMVFNKR